MAVLRFEKVDDYLSALHRDPTLATISMQMAADFRAVSRAAIDGMVRTGRLEEIRIAGTRCVRASGLIAIKEKRAKQVAQVRKYLEECALERKTSFYEPVMDLLHLKTTVPADRKLIGEILGTVSEQTHADHNILLSVIVHRKSAGRTTPGPGFFALAKYLKLKYDDEDTFVTQEMQKVWHHYAPPVPKQSSAAPTR